MTELSLRALAHAGETVQCPYADCGDCLYPRNLRRHLEGQKHGLTGAELEESCKRARLLPDSFVVSVGGGADETLAGGAPDEDVAPPPSEIVSPAQLRLLFRSCSDGDGLGLDLVAVATLALRVHLEQPNIGRALAANAVRAAVAMCDDLALSACRCFVSRVDDLPGDTEAGAGARGAGDGASWLPWANGTECVLWLLMNKLCLSEDQQTVLLHALRLPFFRLVDVPQSAAFYQRVAKELRPTAGRVVVETPPDAVTSVDVLPPSELLRIALNAPVMYATLRTKPFAYALHDPCADHFSSTRLARRHPLLRLDAADSPAGRLRLGDVVRVGGKVVRIIEFYLAPPQGWTATATHRLCPEKDMVLAFGGEALLKRAAAGSIGALAPASAPHWHATFGIAQLQRVDERHYIGVVTRVLRLVPSFGFNDDWHRGDADAVRVFFELSSDPRSVRFVDATHRAYAPLDTAAGVRIFNGEDSPVLWAGTQAPLALPWDFTSYAAVDGNHRWTGDVTTLPRMVITLAGDSDSANVSHNKTGREASLLRASTTVMSAPRAIRHRAPGFSPLAVLPDGVTFCALETVLRDYERLAQGVVFYSTVLGGFVHVTAVLSLLQMDSADRYGQQGLPSHQSLLGCCGGCGVSHVSGDNRASFLEHVSLASLRTDAKALANMGTLGWPATVSAYTARLPSFDNFQQLIVGPLHFAILGVLRKALVLLGKRNLGANGSALADYLRELIAALEAALDDDDKHCSWTARVANFRAIVKSLNGVLTSRLLEVFLFAVNEVVALGRDDTKRQRIDAMTGLVDYVHGLRYMMQAPSTERSRTEAVRLMVAGVKALARAFPPDTHKGDGARGLHTVLAHLTFHVEWVLQLYATGCNVDDAVVEERHQPMKQRANNVNRGWRDTWGRTIHSQLRLLHGVRLAFQEQRYGVGLCSQLGLAAAAFSTVPHVAVAHLVWGSPLYSDTVEVVARSADDISPRPSIQAPPVAACASLSCWCCPGFMSEPALVVWRRSSVTGDIQSSFGVGGVPAEQRQPSPQCDFPDDRWKLLRSSFVAAFPGAASVVDEMRAYGGIKLPGIASAVRVGNWVLVDRAQTLSAWRLLKPNASDPIVDWAAKTLDPLIEVGDDYQFWPERYVVALVRDISAADFGGVTYTMFTPIYYEFKRGSGPPGGGENATSYARDIPRNGRPVGTRSWILERWMGGVDALADEMPLPTSLIRRVPNVVHACTLDGCGQAEACQHAMYKGRPPVVRMAMPSGCTCSAKAKRVRRIVHNCTNNDLWFLSPFDMGNKGRVQW